EVWSGDARAAGLGVTVNGRHYGLFGPSGATWSGLGTLRLTCQAHGKPYFAVAVLPDRTPETLALFRQHAYAHVHDTHVAWAYDPETSTVTTRYEFSTTVHEGAESAPLFALYPHQWRRTSATLLALEYASVRGVMKLGRGLSFSTRRTYPGFLV